MREGSIQHLWYNRNYFCIQLLKRSSLISIQVQYLSLFHCPHQDFMSLFCPTCRQVIFTLSVLCFANYSFSYFLEISPGVREILQKCSFSAEDQTQTRIREDKKQGEAALLWSICVVSSCNWHSAICVLNHRTAQVGKDL